MHERLAAPGGVRLHELLPEARFVGAHDVRVTSCSSDSRTVRPGDLFVAIAGRTHDGHEFIRDAVARGAAAVLAERIPADCPVPACLVAESRAAHARLCQALAGDPSRHLKVVGITGTDGKTTTSYLIASIFDTANYHVGVLGTLGYFDGVQIERAVLTTPAPPVLATWLARMRANGCTHAVLEVSSHALAQSRIAGMAIDVACVTNMRHDHLDDHDTTEGYHRAKARLFDHLVPEGLAVINADDPASARLIRELNGPALSVGIERPAELTATPLETHASEQTFLLAFGNETMPVRTHLIGRHNVYNCLVAAAVGFGYGLDLPTIARGLEAVSKVPGRLERIECGQPFSVFVDFAHTSDALGGCLRTLRPLTRGRLICVFGAGGDRDRLKRPRMGRVVEQLADLAVVTNDNARSESPRAIIDDILSGIRGQRRPRVIVDRAAAIRWSLSQAQPGDCVLIAGRGHEDYQLVGEQRLPFDDRDVARMCLRELPDASVAHRATA